ncbi:TerC family protein [Myxococcota bacterium]|nr:TerC family protein [Myxococcota bacterium]
MLALDLFVFNKKAHEVSLREAAMWSIVWVVLSLVFNAWVYHRFGATKGMEFFAGYLLEKALSVDNLFVFLLVLTHFKVPTQNQHRVLFWGVIGALVLRVVFILAGTALISRFHWLMYVFGAFLVFTGGKMLFAKEDDEPDVGENWVLQKVRRFVPMTEQYEGAAFFVRKNGALMATPMLAVLVVVETTDVVFAVDSIPAVFGITTDPFIVFTSNICAVLGLRALYFLIVGVLKMFRYLKAGLSIVLVFIGAKMLIEHWYRVPIGASLGVIGAILTITVTASIFADRAERRAAVGRVPGE